MALSIMALDAESFHSECLFECRISYSYSERRFVIVECYYDECHNTHCYYADCCCAEC
jgi:hypothetical protein